jgi:oxygen-dependent protoporphyrinogen oxidase
MARVVIVGGGISGLSLGYELKRTAKSEAIVLEAEDSPGGKIRTLSEKGFLCEWGVNGFLDNRPSTLALAGDLGLEPLRSSDAARKRFLCLGGELRKLPETPKEFLTSRVLSFPGKLRLAAEPFIPARRGDEPLADFARRRLGREAFENLIDPMASGIFAGDPEKMSVASCFPRVKRLEENYGSLIKGMFKMSREAKKEGKGPVSAGPGGTLTSFQGGMEDIILGLKSALGGSLRTGGRVRAIEKAGSLYRVYLQDGESMEADVVVLACPSYEAAAILKEFDKALSEIVAGIEYPALSVVCLGFKREKIGSPVDFFGFLVPWKEGRRILGTLYDSSIFPNRAPEGYVLLRAMLGGARAPHIAMQNDEFLIRTVLSELDRLVSLKGEPDFTKVFRHEKAIPQYVVGHSEKLKAMESALSRHKGVYLAGNAYRGVALNDCVENSIKLREKIIKEVLT